ncbi:hypothetical protein Gotri_002071 [Gossypium trilobum]|uniref:RNase H type-1 domain-containing protein n=1 Tax=Gossypium trilobum TaxID=34281 RepID=A0A7J9F776_9ROSI|nr:hypothetical protein [Gossypium trilobum]
MFLLRMLNVKLFGKFQRWVTVQVKRGLKDSHIGGWRFLIGSENGLWSEVAIARDSNGKILDEINALVRTKSVQVAEALALRLGSVLAKRWQWESIIFESDNKE